MQRRNFLQSLGLQNNRGNVDKTLPPPYQAGSLEGCVSCDAPCIGVCETNILYKNSQNEIAVSFESQGCTYCTECATECDKEVLSLNSTPYVKAVVYIDTQLCVAHHQTICMSCKDPCLENAINFKGLFAPTISPDTCTSCGFCFSRCPSNAIKVVV